MSEVWFIRHGESECNAGLATSDPALVPLTGKGHREAESICAAFKTAPVLIALSPYLRAAQSAQYVMRSFPSVKVQIMQIQEFTYLSPSECQHSTQEQRKPMVQRYWGLQDPHFVHGPGAESFAEFVRRVITVDQEMRQQEGFVAAFSHSQFIHALILNASNQLKPDANTMNQFRAFNRQLDIPNAAFVKFRYFKDSCVVGSVVTEHIVA